MPTFVFIESRIMPKQSIASAASTAAVPVTTIVRAKDATLGEGEFIYLKSTASVVVGSLVTWITQSAGSVITAMVPNTASNGVPVAVAQVAGVTGTFAWFQISGTASVKKVASIVAKNAKVFIGATTGRVRALSSTGKNILGMRSVNSVSAAVSTVICTFNRPHQMGT